MRPPGSAAGDGSGAEARGAYYRELARDYPTTIRWLVPDYEGMVEAIARLVGAAEPRSLLDLGCGSGELTLRLAEAAPEARVTAVDLSPEMVGAARDRLAPLGERAVVVERDLLAIAAAPGRRPLPGEPFDLVHSNLVLHNLPLQAKRRTLEAARGVLSAGGGLVWGDLIRFADPWLQEARVRGRIEHAREAGCPEDLLEWNFRKEAEEDFPLTTGETMDLLHAAGFAEPEAVWARDTFLVVWARRGGGS